jgi:hypothetical protein
MTVGELLSKIPESYTEIAINEYDGVEHTGRRFVIEKNMKNRSSIPEEFLSKEVSVIVPYYDRISIEVEK